MNHFIIGLGGTDGKIIRALRKSLYQEFHGSAIPDVGIGYLYVDSSSEMMGIDDPSWRDRGDLSHRAGAGWRHRQRHRQRD